jgi:hypothetical protein
MARRPKKITHVELKFKDKCDGCGTFNYLKGIEGKCLCEECITKISQPDKPKKKEYRK